MKRAIEEARRLARDGQDFTEVIAALRELDGFQLTPFNLLVILRQGLGITFLESPELLRLFDVELRPVAPAAEINRAANPFLVRYRARDFLMATEDPGMQRYFGDIARFMVAEFGITYAEAVARVNEAFKDQEFGAYPDIMCHELPEYWAYGLYYGTVRYWDEYADRSSWNARPAPDKDSVCWTL
ncbi:hypothetical protein [Streptomyces sp. URMC 129]|uniref:hypothetical protein n=1 Tax=Streptomyces sp. URMC 129 TaxID=3423407 RepID=UPI003F1D521E